MVKVIELRKVVQASLKSIHPRVYFQHAPDDAVFPYLVYELPNSSHEGIMERILLDVDGWDNSTDTTALETLMDSADKALQRKHFVIDSLALIFYRDNRLSLLDDDPRLRRRKYIYQVRTYGGDV